MTDADVVNWLTDPTDNPSVPCGVVSGVLDGS
jgi:hypothetical protein